MHPPPGSGVAFHRVRGPGRPFLLAYPWFMVAGSLAVRRWRRGPVQATGAIVLNRVDVVAVHYCHQVGPANASRANPLFRAQVRAASVLKRAGERLGFARSHAAVFACVSEGVAEEVRSNYPELAERVRTIHNGVDVELFAPGAHADGAAALRAALDVEAGQLIAVFVGSEWDRKGLAPAIRALESARGWTLAVAGGGDRGRFEGLAADLGVAERVRWLGIRPDAEVVYGLADAFLLPSAYETFSLVTFEAAASGLPILATPVSGVRELIDDGRNGFLIGVDPDEIARRLNQLGADPGLRARLGEAARESALGYTWERMVAAHDELYTRLEHRSRRSR